jgi:hypothetical protein
VVQSSAGAMQMEERRSLTVGLRAPEIVPAVRTIRSMKGSEMDTNMIIRVVAGMLFVVVLAVLIQRRRTRVK